MKDPRSEAEPGGGAGTRPRKRLQGKSPSRTGGLTPPWDAAPYGEVAVPGAVPHPFTGSMTAAGLSKEWRTRRKPTSPEEWTEETVIQYIKTHYDKVGSSRVKDWKDSEYSAVVDRVATKKLFSGSRPRAIEKAGYEPAKRGRPSKTTFREDANMGNIPSREQERLEAVEGAYRDYGDEGVVTVMGATLEAKSQVSADVRKIGSEIFEIEASREKTSKNIEAALYNAFERMDHFGVRKRVVLYAPELKGLKLAEDVNNVVREKYGDSVVVIADGYTDLAFPDARARHGLSLLIDSCTNEDAPITRVKTYLKQAFGLDVDADSDGAIETLEALFNYFSKTPLCIKPLWKSMKEMQKTYKALDVAV